MQQKWNQNFDGEPMTDKGNIWPLPTTMISLRPTPCTPWAKPFCMFELGGVVSANTGPDTVALVYTGHPRG